MNLSTKNNNILRLTNKDDSWFEYEPVGSIKPVLYSIMSENDDGEMFWGVTKGVVLLSLEDEKIDDKNEQLYFFFMAKEFSPDKLECYNVANDNEPYEYRVKYDGLEIEQTLPGDPWLFDD